jgi:tRNA threonylcarbamoyladenosine biosynthesis protein TsaB
MDQANNIILLNIESATNVCSVALSRDGKYLHHLHESSTRDHASIITRMIKRMLEEAGLVIADLSGVVLSEGPGSYTSLRVGMSVAKGICYGRDIPLIAINTLESLAKEARRQNPEAGLICPMIDARRMEVYASLYDEQMVKQIDNQPVILEPDTFDEYLDAGRTVTICGNGSHKAKAVYEGRNISFSVEECDARQLIEEGYRRFLKQDYADLAYFSPNYIKSPNITQAKKRLL